jgi:hypothetical protein
MSTLIVIIPIVLGSAVLVGFAGILIGMRREDRMLTLGEVPAGRLAGFARWVVGCHVRGQVGDVPTCREASALQAAAESTPPVRVAATGRPASLGSR